MVKYKSLENLVQKHSKHKEFHKKMTKHVFMILLVIAALFTLGKILPSLTGFAVASSENAGASYSSTVDMIHAVRESDNRILFKLYLSVIWMVLIILLSIVKFEHEIRTRKEI